MALFRCGAGTPSILDEELPLGKYIYKGIAAADITAGAITLPATAVVLIAHINGDDYASVTVSTSYTCITIFDLTTGTAAGTLGTTTLLTGHEYLVAFGSSTSGATISFVAR